MPTIKVEPNSVFELLARRAEAGADRDMDHLELFKRGGLIVAERPFVIVMYSVENTAFFVRYPGNPNGEDRFRATGLRAVTPQSQDNHSL